MKIVQWVDPYTNESLTETEKKLFRFYMSCTTRIILDFSKIKSV